MEFQQYSVGKSTITVFLDSIVRSRAEVIVSSDDCELSMGGGVSMALKGAAGPEMVREAHKIVHRRTPARVGDVVVTPAGQMPAKYILHAVTLDWRDRSIPGESIVRHTTRKVMELLPLLRCRSVAFPAIGTGAAGIAPEEAAQEMAAVLAAALLDTAEEYRVEIYLLDRWGGAGHEHFFSAFESFLYRTQGLAVTVSDTGKTLAVADAGVEEAGSNPETERKRIREIYDMLRHMDARRDKVEATLVSHLAGDHPLPQTMVGDLKEQLVRIAQMRRGYEADLQLRSTVGKRTAGKAVFLSSTFEDLKAHRQKAREKVLELGFEFIGMEEFPSWPEKPAEFIQLMVEKAQVYLGILGMRYGFVDESTGLSMTELEYRRAISHHKPVHVFLMDKSAAITPQMVEQNPVSYSKLLRLKAEVTDKHVCSFFCDEADLARKIDTTLRAVSRN